MEQKQQTLKEALLLHCLICWEILDISDAWIIDLFLVCLYKYCRLHSLIPPPTHTFRISYLFYHCLLDNIHMNKQNVLSVAEMINCSSFITTLHSFLGFWHNRLDIHFIYWERSEQYSVVITDGFDTFKAESQSKLLHMLLTFCLSPVRWANSTISLPNWLKICTNSWKVLTLSRWSRVTRTWEEWQDQSGVLNDHILFVFF